MQLWTDFNEKIGAKHFDADAFMMVIKLGGPGFCKFSGSTNLVFRKGTTMRPTYVRMDLPENEAGFTRLKLHYVPGKMVEMKGDDGSVVLKEGDDMVNMEFYSYTPMPGMKGLKTHVRVVSNVHYEYMGDVYVKLLGQEPADTLHEEY